MAFAIAQVTPPTLCTDPEKKEQKIRMWQRLSFSRWLGRDEQTQPPDQKAEPLGSRPTFGRRLSRKVVPGLPRPATFRRQNSERRERLTPVEPSSCERRTLSVDRRRALSARPASPPPTAIPKLSAPEFRTLKDGLPMLSKSISLEGRLYPPPQEPPPPLPPPPLATLDHNAYTNDHAVSEASSDNKADDELRRELEEKWILNLSMHFRDHSPREKFFVTYAETPNKWRRVTVSCDYRDAPYDSLERDLQGLQYQRDKSARIYESIRISLLEIQFYDTVTNLKLETKDDRLHVHVTEDTNEIIPYPSTNAVRHLNCRLITESQVKFEQHMSGFVYKVNEGGKVCVKKEIPGPDSVDEFLYEVNALHALQGSKSVIQLQGLVVDETRSLVKGLLISFAGKGALVDVIYDTQGSLPWVRRERWAGHIVQGLAEIHEAGFVQGDFTLSNIVIDEDDHAKIIDINRRGCPVGWEPPEISKLIESSQRISMYIGVKSDLFQLGMVLWALAAQVDEPERHRPLLLKDVGGEIPDYYREVVAICLSDLPRERCAAKDLLPLFREHGNIPFRAYSEHTHDPGPQHFDIGHLTRRSSIPRNHSAIGQVTPEDVAYTGRASSIDIPFDGPGAYMVSRGRQPPINTTHLTFNVSHNVSPGNAPQIVAASPTHEHNHWEEVEMHGKLCLVDRGASFRDRMAGNSSHGFPHHVDSGLADMDLAGVGGHEALKDLNGETPRGIHDLMLDDDHNG